MDLQPARSISILGNVQGAIRTVWDARRSIAAPMLLLIVLQTLMARFAPSGRIPAGMPPAQALQQGLTAFAAILVMTCLLIAFTTGLQRHLFQGETRSGMAMFEFGAPFWRALGATFLIAIIVAGIALAITLPLVLFRASLPSGGARVLLAIALMLLVTWLVFRTAGRLTLTIPAAVAGMEHRTSRVWDATRHVWWRLIAIAFVFFGIGLVLYIPTLFLGGIDAMTSPAGTVRPSWLSALYSGATGVLQNVWIATSWMLCFYEFFGDRKEAASASAQPAWH